MTAYNAFPFNVINNPIWRATLTKLQQVIVDRTYGTVKFSAYGDPTITATLNSVSEAVESAFVLVERATIPKTRDIVRIGNTRSFSFEGEPWSGVKVNVGATAKAARSMAIKWLSIAAHIEAEEAAKEKADAEAAKVAEAEAKNARATRLGELALEYFDSYYMDLSSKKVRVIEEIYRLEQVIAEEDAA